MGFISHHEIERRLVCHRMRAVIMRKFVMGDILGPGSWVVSTEDSEISFDLLVYSFSFSIGLWVISGGEGKVVFEEFPQFLSEGRGELRATVGDGFVVQAKAEENFVEEKGSDPFGGDGFLSRAENYPLSKPMVDHDQERVKACRDRKICDQVTRDLLEGARSGGFDRGKWRDGGVSIGFVLLAFSTDLDIAVDKEGQARPPEFGGDELAGLEEAGMAGGFMIMAPLKNGTTKGVISGDINMALVG